MLKLGSQDVTIKKGNQDAKVYLGSTLIYDPVPAGAWEVDQLSYQSNFFDIGAQEIIPDGLQLSTDGTKAYVMGSGTDKIFEYDLGTPFDITTAVYNSVFVSIVGEDSNMTGIFIAADGLKLFTVGQTSDKIYQYSMSVAWDLSTLTFDSKDFSVFTQEPNVSGVSFQDDGSRFFITGNGSIHSYTMGTNYDVTTAVHETTESVTTEDTSIRDLTIKPDGTKVYIVGSANNRIFQYTLATPWVLSSISYDSKSLFVGGEEGNPLAMDYSADGTIAYVIGASNDTVYAYEL